MTERTVHGNRCTVCSWHTASARCVHYVHPESHAHGPHNSNMTRKAISASEINLFLNTHPTGGGLAPVWLRAPSPPAPATNIRREPQNAAYLTTWIPRNPGEKPGTAVLTCNPSGAKMVEKPYGNGMAPLPASQLQKVPGNQQQLEQVGLSPGGSGGSSDMLRPRNNREAGLCHLKPSSRPPC